MKYVAEWGYSENNTVTTIENLSYSEYISS